MSDDFLPSESLCPWDAYLASLLQEQRGQEVCRGDGAVMRVRQRQEDLARRAGEAPPPFPDIPAEAAE